MSSISRLATLLVSVLTIAAACEAGPDAADDPAATPDSTDIAAVSAALDRERAAWDAQDIAHYRYTFVPRCFCPPARIAIEVDAAGARVVGIEGDSIAAAMHLDQGVPTIDSLFARLARAANDEPAEMRVRYDPARHYPLESWIDVDRMMADEEWGFEVDGFTVVGAGG